MDLSVKYRQRGASESRGWAAAAPGGAVHGRRSIRSANARTCTGRRAHTFCRLPRADTWPPCTWRACFRSLSACFQSPSTCFRLSPTPTTEFLLQTSCSTDQLNSAASLRHHGYVSLSDSGQHCPASLFFISVSYTILLAQVNIFAHSLQW